MLKKFKPLLLASAILMGATSPALANTSADNISPSQEVVDVKSTVENGKVVTVLKYKDGTETTISTSLPNVINSTTEPLKPVAKPISPQYLPPEDYTAKIYGNHSEADLNSNVDSTRRNSIQSALGITFSEGDRVYTNSNSTGDRGLNGAPTERTSIDELKKQGIYASNANRQELIQYSIINNDWQAYRKLEYKKSPLYFYLTADNKLEYSKVYWAKFIGGEVTSYRENLKKFHQGDLALTKTLAELEAEHKKRMQSYIESWKTAQGPALYVIGFNNTEEYAKEWGVEKVHNDFFDSVYNDPSVIRDGKFSEGAKTRTWY